MEPDIHSNNPLTIQIVVTLWEVRADAGDYVPPRTTKNAMRMNRDDVLLFRVVLLFLGINLFVNDDIRLFEHFIYLLSFFLSILFTY
jgi:hypothetical protein